MMLKSEVMLMAKAKKGAVKKNNTKKKNVCEFC